jgi:hypothetical protein
MFPGMKMILQTPGPRIHLKVTVCLLVACMANVALVCAWL